MRATPGRPGLSWRRWPCSALQGAGGAGARPPCRGHRVRGTRVSRGPGWSDRATVTRSDTQNKEIRPRRARPAPAGERRRRPPIAMGTAPSRGSRLAGGREPPPRRRRRRWPFPAGAGAPERTHGRSQPQRRAWETPVCSKDTAVTEKMSLWACGAILGSGWALPPSTPQASRAVGNLLQVHKERVHGAEVAKIIPYDGSFGQLSTKS